MAASTGEGHHAAGHEATHRAAVARPATFRPWMPTGIRGMTRELLAEVTAPGWPEREPRRLRFLRLPLLPPVSLTAVRPISNLFTPATASHASHAIARAPASIASIQPCTPEDVSQCRLLLCSALPCPPQLVKGRRSVDWAMQPAAIPDGPARIRRRRMHSDEYARRHGPAEHHNLSHLSREYRSATQSIGAVRPPLRPRTADIAPRDYFLVEP
ncbi:hypothetical protein CDD83_9081 [Cordyceps sp. RAO-2017]|nr:hypothetical protein CDD83_9081 [Cordyceps sp. RAO-2017]